VETAQAEEDEPRGVADAGTVAIDRVAPIGQRKGRDAHACEVEARLLDLRRAHPYVALDRPAIHDGVSNRLERHRCDGSDAGVGPHVPRY